jgi:nucleoside-diphosphate-sugar epimerase
MPRRGDALLMEYRRAHGVNATIVRIFNTYGPRMNVDDGRVVPEFIAAALDGRPMPLFGEGLQTRSFCYVDDLVEALLLVALDSASDGMVLNMGNPHEVTMLELSRVTAAGRWRGGSNLPASEGSGPAAFDIARMRERYGWEPRIPLAEGLSRTVAYFRQQVRAGVEAA